MVGPVTLQNETLQWDSFFNEIERLLEQGIHQGSRLQS